MRCGAVRYHAIRPIAVQGLTAGYDTYADTDNNTERHQLDSYDTMQYVTMRRCDALPWLSVTIVHYTKL